MDRGCEEDNKQMFYGGKNVLEVFFMSERAIHVLLSPPRQNLVYTITTQAIFSSLLQTQKCLKLDFTEEWILIIFQMGFYKDCL